VVVAFTVAVAGTVSGFDCDAAKRPSAGSNVAQKTLFPSCNVADAVYGPVVERGVPELLVNVTKPTAVRGLTVAVRVTWSLGAPLGADEISVVVVTIDVVGYPQLLEDLLEEPLQ
jgi:hypothetical protein